MGGRPEECSRTRSATASVRGGGLAGGLRCPARFAVEGAGAVRTTASGHRAPAACAARPRYGNPHSHHHAPPVHPLVPQGSDPPDSDWLDGTAPLLDLCFMRDKAAVGADLYLEDSRTTSARSAPRARDDRGAEFDEPGTPGPGAATWEEIEALIRDASRAGRPGCRSA